ncbi:hypothetical protein BV20DRAFT_269040 [Pilatotrama ljubarskyi]|nr:hypothetical protein BV20DRAFT_269040 [Pilatotrama ljubarskyi]
MNLLLASHTDILLNAFSVKRSIHERTTDGSDEPDGRSPAGPPSLPPHSSGDHQGSTVSPAVPSMVVLCCFAAVVLFVLWFLRRVWQHRRLSSLLERLGFAPRPELIDLRMQRPRVLRPGESWASLSPLAVMKAPTMVKRNLRHFRHRVSGGPT